MTNSIALSTGKRNDSSPLKWVLYGSLAAERTVLLRMKATQRFRLDGNA